MINEYITMELHKRREQESISKSHNNRALAEIINEFKQERSQRRTRKTQR